MELGNKHQMSPSSFMTEALDHLKLINWRMVGATESEREALKGARAELMQLIQTAARSETTLGPDIELS